tara:strand:+ start:1169 stop:2401 length:1233 start_codon:yes stop_codon:yes gene_type:complete
MIIDKINWQIKYLKANSKFYKSTLAATDSIKTISDYKQLPFTTKEDLSNYNNQFLSVKESEIRDFLTTSGTTGEPISFYLTNNDLKRLGINERNSFSLCGIIPGNKILLTTTLDKCFVAGLAYYLGAKEMGVGIIRVGPGNLKYQWDMIKRFLPEVIIAVPSFLLKMIKFAKENNINLRTCSLKKAICIGEPIRQADFQLNSLGKEITSSLDVQLFSTYASTEMMTAFTECSEGKGGHLQEDLLYVEVLDENENEVKEGESGEVVITTFGVEGMPLLRYRTGDICNVYREECSCGRSSLRLGPVLGRKNHRLKIKGTTTYPNAMIEAIYSFGEIDDFLIEVSFDQYGSDKLCLFVARQSNKDFSLKELKDFLKSKLLFTPDVRIVDSRIIEEKITSGVNRKKIRFVDNRK